MPGLLSSEVFDLWVVDYLSKKITIVLQDGTSHSEDIPPADLPMDDHIAASIFHWDKWWISIVTNRLDVVYLMGFNPDSDNPSPSLPSVYLDQNMWSRVAATLVAPERVTDSKEREAAKEVIRLASDAGIVLPLSSAHLLETSGLHTERRYEVGLAIAKLSNGWQMRHPINVWQQEAAWSLGDHLALSRAKPSESQTVITTEPGIWQRKDEFGFGMPFAGDASDFLSMLTAPAVLVSTLIDPDSYDRDPTTSWVTHHQTISTQMARLPKAQRPNTARRRFWNENISFYRRAARSINGVGEVPVFSDRELRRLLKSTPMISLLSEMFVQRFIDNSRSWEKNDLIDMLFLTCAAGHCDYVVAEAHTASQLRQIQRSQGKPQTVFANLSDLVAALHTSGVTTDEERNGTRRLGLDSN